MNDTSEIRDVDVDWFGFPVTARNAPVTLVGNQTILDLDPGLVEQAVCRELVCGPCRLTGNQVCFMRHHLGMTQAGMAALLHQANHSIVSQWEAAGNHAARMNVGTEMFFRLMVARKVFPPGELHRVMDLLAGLVFLPAGEGVAIDLAAPSPLARARPAAHTGRTGAAAPVRRHRVA